MPLRVARIVLAGFALPFLLSCGAGNPDIKDNTPPPKITSFTVSPAIVTTGDPATLMAVFPFGAGSVSSDTGETIGSVTSGTAISVHPTRDTKYTLLVTNVSSMTQDVSIKVAPFPISVITAPSSVTAGSACSASVTGQTECTYAWTLTNGTINSGGTPSVPSNSPTLAFTAGSDTTTPLSLTCTIKNAAGTSSTSAVKKISVVSTPLPPAILAPAYVTTGRSDSASVVSQTGLTYAWSINTSSTSTGSVIAGGNTGTTVSYIAGSAGKLTLDCTISNSAQTSTKSTTDITILDVPGKPSAIIVSPYVSAGQTGYSATVTAQLGCSYVWSISNGAITAGGTANAMTFSAANDTSKPLTLTCKAVNAAGSPGPSSDTANVQVLAGPTTPVITALPYATTNLDFSISVTAQSGCQYAWSIDSKNSTSLGSTIKSGNPGAYLTITAGTVGTLTLNCTVTDSAGASASASRSVGIVAAPIATISAPALLTAGLNYQASVTAQTGCTYLWGITNGKITSTDLTTPSISFTAGTDPTNPLVLNCNVINLASTPASTPKSVTIIAAAIAPVIAASDTVTTGTANLAASVTDQPGCTYTWTLTGGTFTGGGFTTASRSVTYTAGAPGSAVLSCKAKNAVLDEGPAGTKTIAIVAAPIVPVVTATSPVTAGAANLSASVPEQTGCTFNWTITGGTFAGGALTATGRSVTYTAGGSGTLVLSCKTKNAALDESATGTKTIAVIAAAVPPIITAPTPVNAGVTNLTASVPDQADCTFAWTITGGTFVGGSLTATGPNVTFAAGAPGTLVLSCKAKNAALDESAAGTKNVTVVAAPIINFSASSTSINQGQSTTLTWSTTNAASVTISPSVASGSLTLSGSVSVIPTDYLVTYTLTAKNAVGDAQGTVTKTVTITMPPPVITTFGKTTIPKALTLCTNPLTYGNEYDIGVGGTWESGTLTSPPGDVYNPSHTWPLGIFINQTSNIVKVGSDYGTNNCATISDQLCSKASGTWTLSVSKNYQTVTQTINFSIAYYQYGGPCGW